MYEKCLINIGACLNKKDISKTGGVVVLFEAWLQYCREQELNTKTIDTNKANYQNVFIAYFSIIWQFIRIVRRDSVIMLHGTAKDYLYIAPIIISISKLYGLKVVLRKFAGNFEKIYEKSNRLKKTVFRYVLRNSDIQFWETKSLVSFGQKLGKNSLWFPNVRVRSNIMRDEDLPYKRRFIFLSRVEKVKGIDVLKECFASLPEGYHVDIYGPVKDYELSQLTGKNFTYVRALEAFEVTEILSKYDVLVLPSMWKGEGYPGIIIESYSVGLPVVASIIGAIPEIVEDGKTGFLVSSGSVGDLRCAILSINDDNYHELMSNARKAFDAFDAQITNEKVLKYVMS